MLGTTLNYARYVIHARKKVLAHCVYCASYCIVCAIIIGTYTLCANYLVGGACYGKSTSSLIWNWCTNNNAKDNLHHKHSMPQATPSLTSFLLSFLMVVPMYIFYHTQILHNVFCWNFARYYVLPLLQRRLVFCMSMGGFLKDLVKW